MTSDDAERSLLEDFATESQQILDEVEDLIFDLETGSGNSEGFVTMAQRIDGIMGCAKTLGLDSFQQYKPALAVISNMAEGCKMLGYKASQVKDSESRQIIAGFFAEGVEMLSAAVGDLKKGYISFDQARAEQVKDRLLWIVGKLKLSPEDQAKILSRFGLK